MMESDITTNERIPLWNPHAASLWSFFLTPIFGSYLHALNWKTLYKPDRARSAGRWFYVSLAIFALCGVIIMFMEKFTVGEQSDMAAAGLVFLYFITWYFSSARVQERYVEKKFGTHYARRSWFKPLLIGVAAIVGYSALLVLIGLIFRVMIR